MKDRRAGVFALIAVGCLAIYPVADRFDGSDTWQIGGDGWSWVALLLAFIYGMLALLSWFDARGQRRLEPRPLGYDRTKSTL